MPNDEKSQREDAGKPRIHNAQEPERILLYLPGYGVGPKIAKAIRADVKRQLATNPKANSSTVLIEWISDHLGLKP